MSGGVGPTYDDIRLPKEQQQKEHQHLPPSPPSPPPLPQASTLTENPHPTKTRFLSFRQLNILAILTVLSASGLISIDDLTFVILSSFYIYFLSKFAFPVTKQQKNPKLFNPCNKIFRSYIIFAGITGILLPVLYIFHGVLKGDKEGTKAAAPHVFLLASQVFMEGVTFSVSFSSPVRILVPIMYNARRIFTLEEWLIAEFYKEGGKDGLSESFGWDSGNSRVYVGKVLAVSNMMLWCFNLFCFLLPVALPKAMKKYYTEEDDEDDKVD